MKTGRRGDPAPDAVERVILDECVAPTAAVTAEIIGRLGSRPVDIVALATDHPGMPDVVILDRMLGPSTLLVTRDRVLHNLALDRGFRSLVHTPETGWTDRRLAHVAVPEKRLPVPTSTAVDDFFAPMAGDVLALNRILNGLRSERQQKHFRYPNAAASAPISAPAKPSAPSPSPSPSAQPGTASSAATR